ncbi:hypothetical protein QT970_03480 [Microcoleus sp. herbarium8]|uniref:hypothetical protein n=1 Tax=Microcoleus sp. herbarium8 TaxID=3055436 RepID=UPI002FD3657D
MSKPTKPTAQSTIDQSQFKSRMILAPQSAGRIGKSTISEALLEWYDFAGIDATILDLDAAHLTLSKRYPEIATAFPDAAESADGWAALMNAILPPPSPAMLLDMPAQATDHLLEQLIERGNLATLSEQGVRITCLIITADDNAAITSAGRCVQVLGDRVDWVIVRAPGPKRPVADFEQSPLGKQLTALGAATLTLPEITRPTLDRYKATSQAARQWLPMSEASKSMPPAAAHEIAYWRNRALAGCEDIAAHLLPDVSLIQTKVQRLASETLPPKSDFDEFANL